jgi:hypothetical protein
MRWEDYYDYACPDDEYYKQDLFPMEDADIVRKYKAARKREYGIADLTPASDLELEMAELAVRIGEAYDAKKPWE